MILSAVGFFIYKNSQQLQTPQATSTSQPQPTTKPIVSPTTITDPTIEWKTYTSDRFKFKFDIPTNLDVYNGPNYSLVIAKKQEKEIEALYEIKSDILIQVNANRTGEYANYEQLILNRKNPSRHPSKLDFTEKDGYVIFSGWWPGPFSTGDYFKSEGLIKQNSGAIYFHLQHKTEEKSKLLLLDQILSTFQFSE